MHGGMATTHGFPMNNLPTIESVVVEFAFDAKYYHHHIMHLLTTTASLLASPIALSFSLS
jgi:hypothetical protein